MSNWFDENNTTPENKDTPLTDEKQDQSFVPSESDREEHETPTEALEKKESFSQPSSEEPAAPPTSEPSAGWYTSPSVSNPTSWNSTGASQQPPYQTGNTGSTYHYGVNSGNPVPNSTNNYQQPYPSQQNGYPVQNSYQPQGGYDPYAWQRAQNQRPAQPPVQPPKPPKKKKKGAAIAIATLGVVCAAAIVTLSVLLAMAINNKGALPNGGTSSQTTSGPTSNSNAPTLQIEAEDEDAGNLTTASIVALNLDSTVVITTYTKSASNFGNFQFGNDDQLTEAGAATGIIMTADGYIITNWHVVVNENTGEKYDRVDVKTYDGTEYKGAEVVGADQSTDLAVIKIYASGLNAAEFGDSANLKLGDKIVAIGNAGGLNWTTTQGIVSGLARDVYEDTGYAIKCLQVDAAINPGNSGGPLLNSQGKVVGINSAKIVASGYEGLGFSIPINEAKTIIDDLVAYGYVKGRVQLGIKGVTITQSGYEGFRISEISSNSCFSGTNAAVGDIIVGVEGTKVTNYAMLRSELAKHKVGDTITINLMRVNTRTGEKNNFSVQVTLQESQG